MNEHHDPHDWVGGELEQQPADQMNRRRRMWVAAAAATLVVGVGVIVAVGRGGDDRIATSPDTTTATVASTSPPAAPATPTSATPTSTTPATSGKTGATAEMTTTMTEPVVVDEAIDCATPGELAAFIDLLASHTERYPAAVEPDLSDLVGFSSAIARGPIGSVAVEVRAGTPIVQFLAPGATPIPPTEATQVTFDRGLWSWDSAEGPDPLAAPIPFEGVEILAFVTQTYAESTFVGCAGQPLIPVGGRPAFVDVSWTIDDLATYITAQLEAAAGWVPECVDRLGPATEHALVRDGLAELVPLGAVPALRFEAPEFQVGVQAGTTMLSLARIPGGVLVAVKPDGHVPYGDLTSVVVAVDDDGSVRWRRCLPDLDVTELWAAPAESAPQRAFIVAAGERVQAIDVDTGDLSEVVVGERLRVEAVSNRYVLITQTGGIVVIDLVVGGVEQLGLPEAPPAGWDGLAWAIAGDVDDDAPVITGRDVAGVVVALWQQGEWSTSDAAAQVDAELLVRETWEPSLGIEALDAAGRRVWFYPTEGGLNGEGFRMTTSDAVTIANVCIEGGPAVWECARPAFVGIDALTGTELWRLDGFRSAVRVEGRRALITAELDHVVLIDIATGEQVGTHTWSLDHFGQGCCGEGDYLWVGGGGGLVWSVDGEWVTIWYPEPLTTTTRTLDLLA